MKRRHFGRALALLLLFASVATLRADVKTQEKNLVTFGGMLGRMANIFGGKAAKEGVVSTVAVVGDRKMSVSDTTGAIIDLKEEKIYNLDMRRKTYTVTTFEELRRRMQEMQAKAEKDAKASQGPAEPAEPAEKDKNTKEYEIDFNVKNTGQTRTINGFDTQQVVVTVTVREKGKTLEESGGLVMTADNWMTKTVPALKDLGDFERRYAEKIQGPMTAADAQQMATALAMYPGLKEGLARYQKAGLEGTPILTTMTMEAVRNPADAAKPSEDNQAPASIGGLLGGFGRKLAQKKDAKDADQGADSNRSTFMTTNHEVMSISASVAGSDVAMPSGFKER